MDQDLEKKLGWIQDQNQTESNGEGWVIVKWYEVKKNDETEKQEKPS